MTRLFLVIGFVLALGTVSRAQLATPATAQKCPGQIYSYKEVTRRARVINLGAPTIPAGQDVHGTVIINAVLCRNGQVTDVEVVKGLPFGVTESAINAVLNAQFSPAELNLHSVSQTKQFQFHINDTSGTSGLGPAVPRLVEEIDIIGNRRMEKEEILSSITTRPGDPYNLTQVEADFQELLKTGYFDKLGTRLTVEDAPRGGVRVSFEVKELPLIAEVAFERSARGQEPAIINELARQHLDLRVGRPFDPVNLKKATKVIEDYFRAQGWINVKAEASVENLMATEVKIVFKITGTNF